MSLVKRRNYTLKCLDGGLLSKESISGACLKITQTILIFLLLTISRIFRLKLTKIRDYMRYVCIQFMAVTLWSIELYSDTQQEYKKVTKKNARKCSIEIRRVEFYFFRPKRTSSRQMLAKTSFFYICTIQDINKKLAGDDNSKSIKQRI